MEIMRTLEHPHIVRFLETVETEQEVVGASALLAPLLTFFAPP